MPELPTRAPCNVYVPGVTFENSKVAIRRREGGYYFRRSRITSARINPKRENMLIVEPYLNERGR